ncbi:MAG: helix-turn-helix transcriptional regulator [Neisseria sp.]|nr:helix-turn-helix transcriptional regulator [Neisseria subflava]MDU8023103.1 helix-turn-helix transcriptional regulator [Neisseria sp.]
MIERGERNPALLNLIRLASALDISLPELLTFKDYVNDGNCDNESN